MKVGVNLPMPNMESFKGEKALAIATVILSIVTTALLLKVLLLQHQYFENEITKQKNGKVTT
jgi:hypothetical protein